MESRQTSQPQGVDRYDRPPVAATWYGWQTFSTDGAAAVLLLSGVASHQNSTVLVLSGLTFAVGAPVVHLTHGQWEMAILSLSMRGLGPLFGAAIGSQSDVSACTGAGRCDSTSANGAITGIAVAGLLVAAVDGLAFAYDRRWAKAVSPPQHAFAVDALPRLVFVQHGATLGISGAF